VNAAACWEPTRCVIAADIRVAMCFRVGDTGSAVRTACGEIVWEHSMAGGAL
jgi:hypothetical protein